MRRVWVIFSLLSFLFTNCGTYKQHNRKSTDNLATNIRLADQSGRKIPIMAWGGVTLSGSPEMYKDMAEAGFTINYSPSSAAKPTEENIPHLFAALDRAHEVDVKQMVGALWLDFLKGEDLDQLINHPALAGYYIYDEPTKYELLDSLDRWVGRIRKIDDKHFCYINLAGADCRGINWAPELIGCTGVEPSPYTNFVRRYSEIDIPMVSVDRYPVVIDTVTQQRSLFPGWYYTLERTSIEARRTGKELWAFAMSTELFLPNNVIYPVPTKEDLRLQMYSNLAYGSQVLQYYTYVPSKNTPVWGQAPVTMEGVKTSSWYVLKEVNQELQALAPVFVDAKVNWVAHTGEIPDGCVELDKSELPTIIKNLEITGGKGALVSSMKKGEDNFLIIVNHDINENISVKATSDGALYQLDRSAAPIHLAEDSKTLTPGDICIYFWKD